MDRMLEAFCRRARELDASVIRAVLIHGQREPEVAEISSAHPCQNVYSVAKAFAVTAVGILWDRGLIRLDDSVTHLLADEIPDDAHPWWSETTPDMLMRHEIGLPAGFLDIDCADSRSFGRDYLAYTVRHDLDFRPGERRCYTDAAFYLISRIVERCAGMPLDDFLWQELFGELGMREAAWSHCPMGHAMGATGLYIRAEDMARLGALYRDGGMCGGKRILSKEWVERVHDRGYELRPLGTGNAYGKGGMLGQMVMVVPETECVFAWQSFDGAHQRELVQFAASCR